MRPIERSVPPVACIVARSVPDGVIGRDNELPWRLRTDLRFFRSVTEHHIVIMGRKTWQSLGRPLPNRINIVVSRSPGPASAGVHWADGPESALRIADLLSILEDRRRIVVIGGAQIYRLFMHDVARIYLTEVHHSFDRGDAYFREVFEPRSWDLIARRRYGASAHDQYDFDMSILERKGASVRHRRLNDFLGYAELKDIVGRGDDLVDGFERVPGRVDDRVSLPPSDL